MSTKELDREEEIRKKSAMLKIAARHANWEQIKVIYADEIRQHTEAAVREARIDEFSIVNGIWSSQEYSVTPASAGRKIREKLLEHQTALQSHNQEEVTIKETEAPSTNSNLIGGMK